MFLRTEVLQWEQVGKGLNFILQLIQILPHIRINLVDDNTVPFQADCLGGEYFIFEAVG